MAANLTILGEDVCYFTTLLENAPISIGSDYGCVLRIPDLTQVLNVVWTGEHGELRNKKSTVLLRTKPNTLAFFSKHPEKDTTQDFIVIFSKENHNSKFLEIPQNKKVFLGRTSKGKEVYNDISIDLPYISRRHMSFSNENGNIIAEDMQSTNGVYLNGKRMQRAVLRDGDVLTICSVQIRYKKQRLCFENAGPELQINVPKEKAPIKPQMQVAPKKLLSPESLIHKRSPRFVSHVDPLHVQLEKPPTIGAKPQINWFSVLATPALSLSLMVVMTLIGLSPVMLIMSGPMAILSAIMAIRNYRKQTKTYEATGSKRETIYKKYLNKTAADIERVQKQHLDAVSSANPDVKECVEIVAKRNPKLWERTPEDEDFLSVRLGNGRSVSIATAQYVKSQLAMEEDPLEKEAEALVQKYLYQDNVPILCNLRENMLSGLVGSREETMQLLRNMVAEICAVHSYDEVKIVSVFPEAERAEWAWMRWLPHCADNDKSRRYLATEKEAEAVLDEIWTVLQLRAEKEGNYGVTVKEKTPYYLFVTSLPGILGKHPIGKPLFSGRDIGAGALFLSTGLFGLPKEVGQIIELHGEKGVLFKKTSSADRQAFKIEAAFSLEKAEVFARSMASITTATASIEGELPHSVSFLQGYGVRTPAELNIGKRWTEAKTYKSLAVPIAARRGGSAFFFDVHEKRQGVHGVVAGTTGSGKTELVQTWLLSLATNFSPRDINFVLIDFKGTGMIAPFRKLPHLAGSISNLDKKSTVDRNLVALRNEIHRREAVLDKYSEEDSKSTINRLNKNYEQGKADEKLPILIIAIDEYAEFKKAYPSFGAEIDSLVSVGRSLGIFLILMTQKPGGIISQQVEHNIRYRWCLRVANASASKEMLGKPDAARLSRPGQAYVKIGEDELYEQIQAFWCGAPFDPNREDEPTEPVISRVSLSGVRTPCSQSEQKEKDDRRPEVEAVVEHIRDYCKKHRIPAARQVWTAPLPDTVELGQVIGSCFNGLSWPQVDGRTIPIGLMDVPAEQTQRPMAMNPGKEGHTVIYGNPMSGKTTLLKTFAVSLAMKQSPAEANIYALEFGGRNLNILEALPHVGGVAHENNPEKQSKLMMLLEEMLQKRKEDFNAVSVGSIEDYRAETGQALPCIYLLVDGIGTAKSEHPHIVDSLAKLTREGGNYGIYMVATAATMNAVPSSVNASIASQIALSLNDKTDYSLLVGKVEAVPAVPGRGYIKGTPPMEFQTALPAPGTGDKAISESIRTLGRRMSACWHGPLPEPIPEMPETIYYGTVKSDYIALGLSCEKVKPVYYDPAAQHYFLISGMPGSGKSSMLQVMARQVKEKLGGSILGIDVLGSGILKEIADTCIQNVEEIGGFFESLMPVLTSRQSEKKENPAATFETICLAVDDYGEFANAIDEKTKNRLLAILKLGAGLGVYFMAAGEAYSLTNGFKHKNPIITEMATDSSVAAIGGTLGDHGILPQQLYTYSQKSIPFGKGCGVLLRDGTTTLFKMMYRKGENK